MPNDDERLKDYPKTENFEVVDTIGVPHPFCITNKHVVHASNKFSGRLGGEAILDLEGQYKHPSCGMKGCNLSYGQHEQALVVKCHTKDKDPLQEYLQSIVGQCEKDGFAGFTLMLAEGVE